MKRIEAHFSRTQGEIEPVREFLKQLDQPDRKSVGEDIATVEYGWPLGMPTCRPLGNRLWEALSNISSKRIVRVILCIANQSVLLLHALTKKTQKTPPEDMNLALLRNKELEK
ncbi:type II toxin-antitoxin system RelE/ParE family toxin [Thalassospira indica]|uniref:Type II toxin-antitoxin system RelE/ParE family toxin n=1 Tax=Thalassospira indica TaxID=1891279 RepID=A0ABM6XTJ3_9PROT|nr:type II toxin-antitoxin system RelE/ParE family toxin [Thalassospira indica]AXO12863.1 type II toxin-antitoxin system RelE/ParE family toxin [Thalassospira indica]OAZ15300.1 hypothetical protein TH15_05885 [Thalassospira profundimaris]